VVTFSPCQIGSQMTAMKVARIRRIQRDQEWLLGQELACWVGRGIDRASCVAIELQLTVTGIRLPEVTGNDPSPLVVTYLMSTSSTASSIVAAEAFNLPILFLPINASRSKAAKSSN
jgi:hypothetical protein